MSASTTRRSSRGSDYEFFQRLTDLIIATTALAVLALPMFVIAVCVRVTSPGPALFRQERVGYSREPFTLYKYRTMRIDGDDRAHRDLMLRELRGEDTSVDGSCKLHADPRITPLGRWLRRTSLDELPQLINVVRGSMSLVGPRPCLVWEAELFPEEYEARFSVRPGITGLWQVTGRSTLGTLDMLRLDLVYVEERSLRRDIGILMLTVPALLRGLGAR
ncbi:lipopolysaccharide/colanic/teichoic acid biosynthesis glycosyltransferase [Pseudonocardia hierapolitana]|uniref:Lipopolysaccharide/colanic/teichoic acid biosynthesis glycosyltransferase n=1 Tax=Pseudonocardia hierapolitana TaxID=1128676 RepID=A0A561SVU4_9PSEU|nr:sugar transferase [Pseudonocardia hierapolitana]TWF78984.1 lipopolysaccharide/colanic/teichoic acid biosynthesis glycosyltransferase [Pseudonocardia hierapolitana]